MLKYSQKKDKKMSPLKFKMINSPVGVLKIIVEDEKLVALLWENDKPARVKLESMQEAQKDPLLLETEKQLNEYFHHQRELFELPLKLRGTPFQKAVWHELTQIPFGATVTYQEIAIKVDRPKAVRAVGGAIGRNPLSIITPCHRVIGSTGHLTGFAGGLPRKKFLLELEKRVHK
jgi:methylated-DNA-[protein]-cysteine S-methyltransferase